MRKIFAVPIACLFLLGACSEKDDAPSASQPEAKGVVFELSAVNTLDVGSPTRAPLYSQEAVQSVEVVNVYVFKKSGSVYLYLKTFAIPNWVKGSAFQRYEIAPADTLLPGDYKFLAVGTDNAGVNPYTLTATTPTTKFDDFSASIASAANQELEIFAGSKAVSIVGSGARVPIQMTRQVAGVLGYFKNVPVDMSGHTVKYLKLTVSNADLKVNLTTGVGSTPTNANYDIIRMDLSTQAQNSDGAYVGNDLTAQGVVKLPNSQLAGAFLIPVNGITMTLGLYDQSEAPIKTWTVLNDGSSLINIQPNHFYSLGVKTQAGNTNGGGGTGSTPDSPVDLMKDQVIILSISPNWTTIHNLVIQ